MTLISDLSDFGLSLSSCLLIYNQRQRAYLALTWALNVCKMDFQVLIKL